jgi:hypothetical protein
MTDGLSSSIHEIALADIHFNPSFQVRRKLDDAAVGNYARRYQTDAPMPPIRAARLPGGALVLIDGWHRVEALRALGRQRTMVEIVETTERDAVWLAASANLQHGVQLRGGEYRLVFLAYITARRHYDAKGKLKSYREMALEIGGTRSYTTVRNWMIKHHPEIAARMGGAELAGPGGLRDLPAAHPDDGLLASGISGADNAAAAARGIGDPLMRGRLIEGLRKALRAAEAGPYKLPVSDDF